MDSTITPSAALYTDWVVSTASNAHVAKNHEWFVNYEPFRTTLSGTVGGGNLNAIGIGDAIIPVKIHPKRTGPASHGTLHLHDVLHVPDSICNVVAMSKTKLSMTFNPGVLYDADGRRVATLRDAIPTTLPALLLSGTPYGPGNCASSFQEGMDYVVSVMWPAEEEQRWRAYVKELEADTSRGADSKNTQPAQAMYTEEELGWLDQHFGGEEGFLKTACLEADDEEDREMGREIMRGIRSKVLPSMPAVGSSSSGGPSIADLVRAMAGDVTAGLFTEEELECIEDIYGGVDIFMEMHGLDPSSPENCGDAKEIVRALMKE